MPATPVGQSYKTKAMKKKQEEKKGARQMQRITCKGKGTDEVKNTKQEKEVK
jgi:hypothetical protein